MRSLLLILPLLGSACTAVRQEHGRQSEALRFVWSEQFQRHDEPPVLVWREDQCPSSDSGRTAVLYRDMCYSGLKFDGSYVEVAWRGKFYLSAFTHELMHARQCRDGYQDPDHLRTIDWKTVADTDESLRQRDL
jgi:hypothetical protein